MGIKRLFINYKLFRQYMKLAPRVTVNGNQYNYYYKLKRSYPYKLYLDGSNLMFKACTGLYTLNGICDNFIASIFQYLQIFRHVNIEEVVVYFDGKPPIIKKHTNEKRSRQKQTLTTAEKIALKDKICKRLLDLKLDNLCVINVNKTYTIYKQTDPSQMKIQLVLLEKGESEIEMIVNRDPDYGNIFISNDSDLFYLLYNKQAKKNIYWYTTNKTLKSVIGSYPCFDMSNFQIRNLSYNAWCVLLACCGCDYLPNIFTNNTFKNILDIIIRKEKLNYALCNAGSISSILQVYCNLFVQNKHQMLYQCKFKKNINVSTLETKRYIEIIKEVIRYSKHGIEKTKFTKEVFEPFIDKPSLYDLMYYFSLHLPYNSQNLL